MCSVLALTCGLTEIGLGIVAYTRVPHEGTKYVQERGKHTPSEFEIRLFSKHALLAACCLSALDASQCGRTAVFKRLSRAKFPHEDVVK